MQTDRYTSGTGLKQRLDGLLCTSASKKISLERNGKSGIIINHNNGQTSCLYKHVLGDVDAP